MNSFRLTRSFFRLASALATSVIAFAAESPPDWTNPLVPQRADPQVLLHSDGYYYLAASVPKYDCLELRRAKTIADLATAKPKVVWKRPAMGAMSGNIWAPEIHFLDGKWYLYFSAGEKGKPWHSIRIYVFENASPNPLEGEWTDKGRIKTKWDTFSLDATVFENKGTRYFVWAQADKGSSNIMISKMDSPTSLTGDEVVLSRPEFPWELKKHRVNEGPAVLVRNGKVFITYSTNATDENYCMGMLTADAKADLLDLKSWTKSRDPVFQSNDGTSQYGPGHNSFTTTPDGKVVILVYHTRSYKGIPGGKALSNPDRATRAQFLPFKPDGTPDFGFPVADGPYHGQAAP